MSEDKQTVVVNTPPGQANLAVTGAKSGLRSTEFWLTLVTAILVQLNGIPLPEPVEGYVVAGLAAVYAVSRGLAKKNAPVVTVLPPG